MQQVAAEITRYLKSTDRMSKTIVFCANEDAAERMRQALVNLNADMVKQNPDYGKIVCRCETVTEGDIIDAIHGPIPATTIDKGEVLTEAWGKQGVVQLGVFYEF